MLQLSTRSRPWIAVRGLAMTGLLLFSLAACAGGAPMPANTAPVAVTNEAEGASEVAATATTPVETAPTEAPAQQEPAQQEPAQQAPEIVVHVSDLPESALSELDFAEDAASPGGKLITLPNNGDELDPPPENDPHLTFDAPVQPGIPYRCWVHMKVGAPKGKSQANVVWVQFEDSVDKDGGEVFRPATDSYLTAQGPAQEGWMWVPCDTVGEAPTVVYFAKSGTTVRVQAGMEGVGFDQVILSPARFLEAAPAQPVVEK